MQYYSYWYPTGTNRPGRKALPTRHKLASGNYPLSSSNIGNPLCFPLYPEVADALLSYIEKTRGEAAYPEVFLSVIGDPIPLINGGTFYRSMKTCFRNAGIIGKSTHAIVMPLRHV